MFALHWRGLAMNNLWNPLHNQEHCCEEPLATAVQDHTFAPVEDAVATFASERPGKKPRVALQMMLNMLMVEQPPLPPPITPPKGPGYVSQQTVNRAWKRACEREAKFPGYLPGFVWEYGTTINRFPSADATQFECMTAAVFDAKRCWSGDVERGRTKQQFVDWMPVYLTKDHYVRRWQSFRHRGLGHVADAAQAIGRMYGIPDDAMRRAGK
jgi:hypothetical protein